MITSISKLAPGGNPEAACVLTPSYVPIPLSLTDSSNHLDPVLISVPGDTVVYPFSQAAARESVRADADVIHGQPFLTPEEIVNFYVRNRCYTSYHGYLLASQTTRNDVYLFQNVAWMCSALWATPCHSHQWQSQAHVFLLIPGYIYLSGCVLASVGLEPCSTFYMRHALARVCSRSYCR